MSNPSPSPRSFWDLFDEIKEEPTTEPRFTDLLREVGSGPEPPESARNCALKFDPQSFFWAMRNLPVREAVTHLLVCGTTGSGKSIAIQLFLQSIVDRFKAATADPNAPEQLILFDAKSDVLPLLASLGLPPEDVWLLNPYDARSAVWSVAEAVQSPAMARSLATLMVPEEKQSTSPFFADAARELVVAVISGLNRVSGPDWTFRDLLCALDSREHIAGVAAQDPRGNVLGQRMLRDDKHSSGVISTLGAKLGHFEQVAALWESNTTGRKFSIKEFLSHPGVLVLGNDPVLRSSFWPINALLLKALSQEILRRPNAAHGQPPRHWFVLDEFRAMERVDCIHDLLNRGRSKGVSVLLGIQSLEGLIEVYQRPGAEDLLSQCANKMFLRAGGPETGEWVEKFFGRVRQMERTITISHGPGGSSRSEQHSVHERSLFLASYFLDLPLPGPGRLYQAVFDLPCQREILIVERAFDDVIRWCRQPPAASAVPAVMPRDDPAGQSLIPWTTEEKRRFGLDRRKRATSKSSRTRQAADPGPKGSQLTERHEI